MPELTTSRAGWTTVAFGDVVRLVTERSSEPEAAGFERFVGLEHIEPGDLRIRRWGDVADGTTFTSVFRPGQVLFGKRRAYQRKVAVADFSGVCSGDIYVLEPNGKQLLPELLPFICQTDAFFEHAVGTSAGSLSPRTNWTSLSGYEFALPPIEEQRRMVVGLVAAQRLGEYLRHLSLKADAVLRAALHCHLSAGGFKGDAAQTEDLDHTSGWPVVALADVASVDRGKFSHRPRNLPEFYGGPYPFAQTGDVAAARGYGFSASQTLSDEGRRYSRSFPPDTVLVTIAAVIGASAITSVETWCTDSVVGIVPHNRDDARFIEYALRYRRHYLENKVATQTAQKNINLAVLRPLLIPWPSAAVRQGIVELLTAVESSRDAAKVRQSRVMQLMSQLVVDSEGHP